MNEPPSGEPPRTGPATSTPSATRRWRPSRVFVRRVEEGGEPASTLLRGRTVWALCAWLGLVCGLAESGLGLGWRAVEYRVSHPDLWVNANAPWVAPLAMAAVFGGLGAVAGLARGVAPRLVARALPVGLVALGVWSALGALPGLHPWASWLLCGGVAVRVGPRVRLDTGGFLAFARRALPWAAGAWGVLFVATGVVPAAREPWALAFGPRAPRGAPNVVLVVLDTVRADHLGLYGYGRATSPRLDARARRGVVFEQARATTPYTLGTHASLFTGHWMSHTSARVNAPLDGSKPTLAGHLQRRGYATAGFVGNIFYGSARYGLGRGFLRYHDVPGNVLRRVTPREFLRACHLGEWLLTYCERKWRVFAPMQRLRLDAEELNREAFAWLDQTRPAGRPFFLFVNYFDAHSPYSLPGHAPQPFARITADRLEAKMKHLEALEARLDARPTAALETEVAAARAEVNRHLTDAYDDGVAWIDRHLDALLRGLDARGLLDDTLVVVTADHGEMLGEHAVIGHGKSLHRPVVHVPLVVLGGRRFGLPSGVVVPEAVSLRDVPATALDLLGDPAPAAFPGRSLRRHWSGGDVGPDGGSPVLSEMEHLAWKPHTPGMPAAYGPLWLLTEGRYAYHRQDHETQGVVERLYDLRRDPGETRDLAGDPARRATLETLRRRLADTLAAE